MVGLDQGSYQWSGPDWLPRIWLRVIQLPWGLVICKKMSWYISQGTSVWPETDGISKMGNLKIYFLRGCVQKLWTNCEKTSKDSAVILGLEQQLKIKTLQPQGKKRKREMCGEGCLERSCGFSTRDAAAEETLKGTFNSILLLLLISTGLFPLDRHVSISERRTGWI